jgi:hypothetical protein
MSGGRKERLKVMKKLLPVALFLATVGLLPIARAYSNSGNNMLFGGLPGGGDYVPDMLRAVMPALVSILVLIASLIVILMRRFSPRDKHWAYATIGTILGFWLPK